MDNLFWGMIISLGLYFILSIISTKIALWPLKIRIWSLKEDRARHEKNVLDTNKEQLVLDDEMQKIYKNVYK